MRSKKTYLLSGVLGFCGLLTAFSYVTVPALTETDIARGGDPPVMGYILVGNVKNMDKSMIVNLNPTNPNSNTIPPVTLTHEVADLGSFACRVGGHGTHSGIFIAV